MDYELRTIQGCPNSAPALKLFLQALAAEGKDTGRVSVREVSSEDEAEALRFHGSPSFIADGRDLFPAESAPALSCRVYRLEDRMAGLPSAEMLRTAVRGVGSQAWAIGSPGGTSPPVSRPCPNAHTLEVPHERI